MNNQTHRMSFRERLSKYLARNSSGNGGVQLSCVARLVRIMAYKQKTNVTCVSRVIRLAALRTNDGCYRCGALVLPHGFKNDECYTCSSLVSPHALKNDERYIHSGLHFIHGLKNEEYLKS